MNVSTISIVLAKNFFQVMGGGSLDGKTLCNKRLNRTQLREFM
jgi:hypothetical protein